MAVTMLIAVVFVMSRTFLMRSLLGWQRCGFYVGTQYPGCSPRSNYGHQNKQTQQARFAEPAKKPVCSELVLQRVH